MKFKHFMIRQLLITDHLAKLFCKDGEYYTRQCNFSKYLFNKNYRATINDQFPADYVRIFISSTHHPWVSCKPSMGTTCQSRTHIYGNSARPCPWEPCTTLLFSTISNIPLLGFSFSFFSPGSLCVGHLGFLCPRWVGTMNTSPLLPHTTMDFDTTCWGINILGSFLE